MLYKNNSEEMHVCILYIVIINSYKWSVYV